MTKEKNELVLRLLLQLAYDFSYIPTFESKLNPDLNALLPEINQLMIDSLDSWFDTEGREFSEDHRRKTSIRFCLTLGVGATWFFCQQKEPIDAHALFNLMAAPRGEDAMDEYIEDIVGLWFSSDSDKHSQWLALCDYCYEVALTHYDWTITAEKFNACLTAMQAGTVIGFGMLMQRRTRAPYKGDFEWDFNVWGSIIGIPCHDMPKTFDTWIKTCLRTGQPIGGNFISQPKENTEFEHIVKCYHQYSNAINTGMSSIVEINDESPELIAIMPNIDSMRTQNLILEKVYERENGVEATITACFADDPSVRITFYDTEYLKNRDQYFIGQCYVFDLYGIAYNATIVPPHQRNCRLKKTIKGQINPHIQNCSTDALHSFIQIGYPHPEVCRFRAPIQEVYNDLDVTTLSLYEVEVGIPYSTPRSDRKHDLSVFIPTYQIPEGTTTLSKGTPIEGTLILMGKMRVTVNFDERPCTEVRTFTPLTQSGTPRSFVHKCKSDDVGKEMNAAERKTFAKKVMKQFLGKELEPPFEKDGPDFLASRHRGMWIKSDEAYNAAERFKEEDIIPGLIYYYQTGCIPVMVYVSLYDEQGQQCLWLKGGTYTAQIHYGSMLPGQRMSPREAYKHEMLMNVLVNAFQHLHIFPLSKLLHKNLHYTSHNLPDPIITREEFLIYIEEVFEANRTAPEGAMNAQIIMETPHPLYIELSYPDGLVDRLDLKTHHGLITEITIQNVKRGKMANK